MQSKMKISLLFVVVLLVTGCSSPFMKPADFTLKPDGNHAVVNFLRPSSFGGAIMFGIWDRTEFVGVVTAKNYVQYKAKPGNHFFMARAENWSGIKADVRAGKNYYILVEPRMGAWKARVNMSVLQPSDPRLAKWMQKLKPITPIPEKRDGYVAERIDHVKKATKNFESGSVPHSVMKASDGR